MKIEEPKLEFLAKYTKIDDYEKLNQHVLDFQATSIEKYHAYKCIQHLMFLEPKIQLYPIYPQMLTDLLSNNSIKVVDIGCCFGQDIRKMLLDGINPSQISAVDVHDGYWQLSKQLFMDNPTIDFSIHDLAESPLKVQYNYAFLTAVLHVLSKSQCENLILNLSKSLKPGGVVSGWTVGAIEAGEWDNPTPKGDSKRFLHSKTSLTELMQSFGFIDVVVGEDQAKVTTNWTPAEQSMKRLYFQARKN